MDDLVKLVTEEAVEVAAGPNGAPIEGTEDELIGPTIGVLMVLEDEEIRNGGTEGVEGAETDGEGGNDDGWASDGCWGWEFNEYETRLGDAVIKVDEEDIDDCREGEI